MTKLEITMLGVLILVTILCSGCAPQQQVYGIRGPGLQADVYHPTTDPLFKNEQ